MVRSMRRPLLLVAYAATVSAVSTVSDQRTELRIQGPEDQKLVPPLDPKSDKKFFSKDYPHDVVAKKGDLHFGAPYPHVQDSDDFDKDYVKDENGDKGEWAAQMNYDTLRQRVLKQREDVKKALEKENTQESELDKLKREEAEAEAASKKAEAAANAAKAKEDAAEKNLEDLVGKDAAEAADDGKETEKVGGKMGAEIKKINKEIGDVEDCEKELKKAKAELAEAMADKKERDEAHAKLKAEHQGEKDKAEQEYLKAKEADFDRMNGGYHKKVTQEEEEYSEAQHLVKLSSEEVTKTEKKLKAAAARLRNFRHQKTDKDGGVYYTDDGPLKPLKGGASAAAPALVSLVAAVALFWA